MDNQLTELEKYRSKLVRILEQGTQIDNLGAAPEWEFFITWINECKNKDLKGLASDRFVNDHNGYLRLLGTIKAYDTILNGIDRFKSAFNDASRRLGELNEQDKVN